MVCTDVAPTSIGTTDTAPPTTRFTDMASSDLAPTAMVDMAPTSSAPTNPHPEQAFPEDIRILPPYKAPSRFTWRPALRETASLRDVQGINDRLSLPKEMRLGAQLEIHVNTAVPAGSAKS